MALTLPIFLPIWFVAAALTVLTEPAAGIGLGSVIGTICLLIGIRFGMVAHQRRLLLFFVPFVISEVFVGVAGAFRGRGDAFWNAALWAFIAIEFAMSGYLIYLFRGDTARVRASTALLAIFSVIYAFFAWLFAGMSLSDVWL